MKKTAIACVALLLTVFSAAASGRDPIDLVVVLDTSSSMYASRKEVSEYIVGPLLTEFLKPGDTFHLISFSDTTRGEISRRLEGPEDIQTIIGRLLLMYPLDPHTDFIAALNDVYQYLKELPESRTKTVVLISDGEHSPVPGSPNAGLSPEDTAKRIEASTSRLKGNGWNFYFIKVPFSGASAPVKLAPSGEAKNQQQTPSGVVKTESAAASSSSAGSAASAGGADQARNSAGKTGTAAGNAGTDVSAAGKMGPNVAADKTSNENTAKKNSPAGSSAVQPAVDVTDVVSESLSSPVVEWTKEDGSKNVGAAVGVVFAEFPADIGKKSRSFSIPVKIRNPSESPMYLETNAVNIDGVDCMSKRSFYSLKPHSDGVIDLNVRLPDSRTAGPAQLLVAPVFAGKIRLMPDQSVVQVVIKEIPFERFFKALAPYVVFLIGFAIALVLLIVIVAYLKRSFAAPNRAVSQAAAASSASTSAISGGKDRGKEDERKTLRGPSSGSFIPESGRSASYEPVPVSFGAKAGGQLASDSRTFDAQKTGSAGVPSMGSSQSSQTQQSGRAAPGLDRAVAVLGLKADARLAVAGRPKDTKTGKDEIVVVQHDYKVKKENARVMLSLWVKDQNRNIGKRNVHLMKAGATLSLGGGKSDFLVFLVPLPNRIADIHFDGESCSFIPRRPGYFPDIGAAVVEDCLGKTIRVVSDKGYELFFKLEMFEDPLTKLNAFLHSIDAAGR